MIGFISARNLIWTKQDQTEFDCIARFDTIGGEVPFTCSFSETQKYDHVLTIWDKAMSGDLGPISDYVPPPEPTPITAAVDQPVSQGAEDF